MLAKMCFVIILFIVGPPAYGQSDTTPPVLVSMDFNPKSIDTSTGEVNVTVNVTVTDDLSGFQDMDLYFVSPSGNYHISEGVASKYMLNNSGSFNLKFSQYSEAGIWTLENLYMRDNGGNRRELNSLQIAALGFPTELLVEDPQSQERKALIAFYQSTNGDSWTNNSGWKTAPLYSDGFSMPGTENTWFGVSVTGDNQQKNIAEINLPDNNLSGVIQKEIGNLSKLKVLQLISNHLSGNIPSELGKLSNLEILDISNNQLTGSIPENLGMLGNLRYLCLNSNKLTGYIPKELANLSNLIGLYLENNQLEGDIPPELGTLNNLEILTLTNNLLSGNIPHELGQIEKLFYIDFKNNKLTGAIPDELANLTNLSELSLSNNELTGEIPPLLFNLPELQELNLKNNRLCGSIPSTLKNAAKLFALTLNGNQFSGTIPELFRNDNWLRLNCSYNKFTGVHDSTYWINNPWDLENQTIPPTQIFTSTLSSSSININWKPIPYQDDGGYYRIKWGTTPGGPYWGEVLSEDKTSSSTIVTGLPPGRNIYFILETYTPSHSQNKNALTSEPSAEISARTEDLIAQFSATPNMGTPDLLVRFKNQTIGTPTAFLWDFGDGSTSTEQHPSHLYMNPGNYDVTLIAMTPGGNDTLIEKSFINVYGASYVPWAQLDLIDNSASYRDENWGNAIDNDISGWDGTVTANGNPPYAVFAFCDHTSKPINQVILQTDTGVDYEERWVSDFTILVSTTGLAPDDFREVLHASMIGGNKQLFALPIVEAKYIKLILDSPDHGWSQLGEFWVCPVRPIPDKQKSSLKATTPHVGNGADASQLTMTVRDVNGKPLIGLGEKDFTVQTTSGKVFLSSVADGVDPGTYTTTLSAIGGETKKVKVYVWGVLIGQAEIEFTSPDMQQAELLFIEGSSCSKDENWLNAIDGDENEWDGTTTTQGSPGYAVFGFVNGEIYSLLGVNLMCDTGIGFETRWVQRFQLMVSTTGTLSKDFYLTYEGLQTTGNWQSHVFPAVNARYVKFIIEAPTFGWRQVGEISMLVGAPLANADLAKELEAEQSHSPEAVPAKLTVSQNYPNPFNPDTRIEFGLPETSYVRIAVYNTTGQLIRTLDECTTQAGFHSIRWDGTDDVGHLVPNGLYLFVLESGGQRALHKMTMLK